MFGGLKALRKQKDGGRKGKKVESPQESAAGHVGLAEKWLVQGDGGTQLSEEWKGMRCLNTEKTNRLIDMPNSRT